MQDLLGPTDTRAAFISDPFHGKPPEELSAMTISETVLILAGGTAALPILFGIRLAMRAEAFIAIA